jgi:hypothetical protein
MSLRDRFVYPRIGVKGPICSVRYRLTQSGDLVCESQSVRLEHGNGHAGRLLTERGRTDEFWGSRTPATAPQRVAELVAR